MSDSSLKSRTTKLIDAISDGLHERREHAAVVLLAALSGQNVFLLGPPGTAKSLLARRLSSAFAGVGECFEYLMQKFSTPDEIFGPVSITELKKDKYVRKPEGFLPTAHFAFLDEIWKSTPAVLNTLLTIINEKKFRNGKETMEVPLKALIAASNETPPPGQGLEALYDRFIVRLHVSPMKDAENFGKLLTESPADSKADGGDFAITKEELEQWRKGIRKVQLSPETVHIIKDIRLQLEEKYKELKVYVSDRRWQQAAILLKAAAFFCDRSSTNLADTLLLRHCLWTAEENREAVVAVVEEAVRACGFETGLSSTQLVSRKDSLDSEIQKELFYSEDMYDTVMLGGKEFFEENVTCSIYRDEYRFNQYQDEAHVKTFCIPKSRMRTKKEFHPVDGQGNAKEEITCNFNGTGSYSVRIEGHYIYLRHLKKGERLCESITVSPDILFHKGDRRSGVNLRLTTSLRIANDEIIVDFDTIIEEIEGKRKSFAQEIATPFVSEKTQSIALQGVDAQLDEVRLQRKDCDRLLELITKE